MVVPAPRRLRAQPDEIIDRSAPVTFTFEGTTMSGFLGDTVVSAIAANGRRLLRCGDPFDPDGVVVVNDRRDARAGLTPVGEGMRVERSDSRSSSRRRTLLSRSLDVIRRQQTPRMESAPVELLRRTSHVDVVVLGAGPSGLAASAAAAAEGASVLLVDHHRFLGGYLRWGNAGQRNLASELAAELPSSVAIELGAVVQHFGDGWMQISQPLDGTESVTTVRAAAVVEDLSIRTDAEAEVGGAWSITAELCRQLINLYGVVPGDRAIVVGSGSEADAAAADLELVGSLVRMVDRPAPGSRVDADLIVGADRWVHSKPVDPGTNHLVTGRGVLGPSGGAEVEKLIAHGVATGRVAARRAAAVTWERRRRRPGAQVGDRPELAEDRRSESEPVRLPAAESAPLGVLMGALAGQAPGIHESPLVGWHRRNGAELTMVDRWHRVQGYGDQSAEVDAARTGAAVHELAPLTTLVGTGSYPLAALRSVGFPAVAPGHVGRGRSGWASRRSNDEWYLYLARPGADAVVTALREPVRSGHIRFERLNAGFTGIDVIGPDAVRIVSQLADGPLRASQKGNPLTITWVAGVEGCHVWSTGDLGVSSRVQLHVRSTQAERVWEAILDSEGAAAVGQRAHHVIMTERGLIDPDGHDLPPLIPGNGSETVVLELNPNDPSLVPVESCRVVDDTGVTLGRVLRSCFSPLLGRSIALAEMLYPDIEKPAYVKQPDGELVAVTVRPRFEAQHLWRTAHGR